MPYRTYDSAWNRTGYSAAPQYPGQAEVSADYPAKCHCGAGMKGCGDAFWLKFRDWPAPDWAAQRTGYVAWCGNGHEMTEAAL